MYKVLLVTDQQALHDVFQAFEDWASLGFERPLAVHTAKEAMLLLESAPVDAVAYVLPKEEGQAFFGFLAQIPHIAGMEAANDPARLRRVLSRLRRTLHERNSEAVLTDVLPLLQEEFYNSLLQGARLRQDELRARAGALQLSVDLASPVCVAHLLLPQGETYLQEVWRYGRDRLEVALRNVFERDLLAVRYALHVCNIGEIKLLACPKASIAGPALLAQTQARIQQAREDIDEFLDMELVLQSIHLYRDLAALCAGEEATWPAADISGGA
ncbi:MAG: hypothetical protein LBU67_06755 [Oscillospiraceae bacterium]|jgi:hypothetical protein|nr:hypothetical protein [Oscillospiraceae bacterium]